MMRKAGLSERYILTPEALSATISYDSAKFPNVIKLDNKTESGNAIGIRSAREKKIRRATTCQSKPLPTRSSMYFQRKSIRNRNIDIKNVPKKGPIKALTTRRLIFFMDKRPARTAMQKTFQNQAPMTSLRTSTCAVQSSTISLFSSSSQNSVTLSATSSVSSSMMISISMYSSSGVLAR